MRIVLVLVAVALLATAGQEPPVSFPSSWTAPAAPFRIIDTIHYVGTVDLASYLIATPEGRGLHGQHGRQRRGPAREQP